jgi:2-C-methyl-D-erythritol 4-phosphate cytidylyltransferase/2-C-methyl-D-erythritol 2,4-cyclodiphosphate synthase
VSVAALIVAAGRGARAANESGRPKQYCRIGGVPLLERTIGAFAEHPRVDDILVVIHPDDVPLYEAASRSFAPRLGRGGRTRCA